MSNIAIFASGSGSNAQRIAEYFESDKNIDVKVILTNNPDAGVIKRAESLNISCVVFNRNEFYGTNKISQVLKSKNIDFIVLAGFLWLIPDYLIHDYDERIINIHPALLPKYGGKGMYGMNVHKKVIENKENESGITIHFVNNEYDKGTIITQVKCPVYKEDTPEDLAERIHQLEYEYFPKTIESLLN